MIRNDMDGNEPRKWATETEKKKMALRVAGRYETIQVGRKKDNVKKKIWQKGKWNSLMARNITEGGKGKRITANRNQDELFFFSLLLILHIFFFTALAKGEGKWEAL